MSSNELDTKRYIGQWVIVGITDETYHRLIDRLVDEEIKKSKITLDKPKDIV